MSVSSSVAKRIKSPSIYIVAVLTLFVNVVAANFTTAQPAQAASSQTPTYFIADNNGTSQSVGSGLNSFTKLTWGREVADTNNEFDLANSQLKASSNSETWLVGAVATPNTNGGELHSFVYKNGSVEARLSGKAPGGAYGAASGTTLVTLNANDTVDIRVSSQNGTTIDGAAANTRVWGIRVDTLPYFIADNNGTSQSVGSGLSSFTKLTWNREVADTNNEFDLANSQLKASSNNETWLVGGVATPTTNGGEFHEVAYKNGSAEARLDGQVPGAAYSATSGAQIVQLNTNDTIDYRVASQNGATVDGLASSTRVWGIRIDTLPYFIADKNGTSQSIGSGLNSTTKVTWGREVADTNNEFDLTNSQLKASSNNETWLVGGVATPTTNGGEFHELAYKNGTADTRLDGEVPGGAYAATSGAGLFQLSTNDTVDVRVASQNGTTVDGLTQNSRLWGFRLGSVTPTYFIADKNGTSQSIGSGLSVAATKLTWGRETADTNNEFDLANSQLKASSNNEVWLIGAFATPNTNGGELHSFVYKNGTVEARLAGRVPGGAYGAASGVTLVTLNANDTVDVRVNSQNGTTVDGSAVNTRIWGMRVDTLPYFIADNNGTSQSIGSGLSSAAIKLTWSREIADSNGEFDLANSQLTAGSNNESWLIGGVATPTTNGGEFHEIAYKNGSAEARLDGQVPGGAYAATSGAELLQLNANDTADYRVNSQNGTTVDGLASNTRVWGLRVDTLPYFIADKNGTSQTISSGLNSTTKLTWGREVADTNNEFDLTNNQLKAASNNEAWLVGGVATPTTNSGEFHDLAYKNGTADARLDGDVPGGAYASTSGASLFPLSTNDTVDVRLASQNGTTVDGLTQNTRLWGFRLG